MNFRLLATTLISMLVLTGCASTGNTSSKYDEVELIEYDNCLSSESEQWNLALTQGNIQRDLMPGGKFWIESENRAYQVEEFALSMCEKYRPKPIRQ